MRSKISLAICIVSGIMALQSCRKNDEAEIPYVQVNRVLYASDPEFNNLNIVGGSAYLTGGSRGLLVYRKTTEEFAAYDRHCPYNAQDPCGQIEVETSGFGAVDSCCGSKFSLFDGSVTNGPAQQPLRIYGTAFDGVKLEIFN